MDLGLRFKKQTDDGMMRSSRGLSYTNKNEDPFEKYSRNRRPNKKNLDEEKTDAQQMELHQKVNQKNWKNAVLNKYRVDINARAPDNQFKRYLLDTKNTFYEQRPEVQLIKNYTLMEWLSCTFFLVLLTCSILLLFVHPFQKECPYNATCGVYPHCFEGYYYHEQRNTCQVSTELLEETQNLAIQIINRLKKQFGEMQCNGEQGDNKPAASINQIVNGIENPYLNRQITKKLSDFLSNIQNQQLHGFQYHVSSKQIFPTQKSYTYGCMITAFLHSKGSFLKIFLTLFIIVAPITLFHQIKWIMKARSIYKELRQKTLKEKTINVAFAKEDLERRYGMIDESLWSKIDEYRRMDRDIVFVQDDFLYWQAI